MTDLIIDDRPRFQVYSATDGQDTFAIPFEYDASAHVKVRHIGLTTGVLTELPSQGALVITPVKGESGTVRLPFACNANDTVIVFGDTVPTRAVQYSRPVTEQSMNADGNRFIMLLQELRRDLRRAFKAPFGEAGSEFPSAEDRIARVLVGTETGGWQAVDLSSALGGISGDVLTLDYALLLRNFGPETAEKAIAFGLSERGNGPFSGWYWDATSELKDDGGIATIKRAIQPESTPGRWRKVAASREVWLGILQSQMQRNKSETVRRGNDEAYFAGTQYHPDFSVTAVGENQYDLTFAGQDPGAGVRVYRPSQGNEGPISSGFLPFNEGTNSVIIGEAYEDYLLTGIPKLLMVVARGSTPLDYYLESSNATVTAITQGTPLRVTVDDVRKIIAKSGSDSAGTSRIKLNGISGIPARVDANYRAVNTGHTYNDIRRAAQAVAGSFDVIDIVEGVDTDVDGSEAVIDAGGAKVTIHDLLDEMRETVTAGLAATGNTRVERIIAFGGEANAGPTTQDLVSTVGGVCQPDALEAAWDDFMQQMQGDRDWKTSGETWCDQDTEFTVYELLRDNNGVLSYEKPANLVLARLPERHPAITLASSARYTAVDLTHIDDRFGLGRKAARSRAKGIRQPAIPFYTRNLMRDDLTVGSRVFDRYLNQEIFDLAQTRRAGRAFFNGGYRRMRSSVVRLPNMLTSGLDFGAWFTLYPDSNSGVTPGYANGFSRLESATGNAQTFVDYHSGKTVTDVYTLAELDVPFVFQQWEPNTWGVITPSRPSAGEGQQRTWTPVLKGVDTEGVNVYGFQIGRWSQAGLIVSAPFQLQVSTLDSVGALYITQDPGDTDILPVAAIDGAAPLIEVFPRASTAINEIRGRSKSGGAAFRFDLNYATTTSVTTLKNVSLGAVPVTIRGTLTYIAEPE